MATIRNQYVVFRLDEQQYALHLSAVERIVRAVAVTPLPSPMGASHVPAQVLGVVNLQGRIIPVISMRKVYGLAERVLQVDDQFIIARTSRSTAPTVSTVALVVDAVIGVDSCGEHEVIAADTVIPGLDGLSAITKGRNEIIILDNLDRYGVPLGEPEMENAILQAALTENGST
jgi:purine-binding chemotaxis protein CheW